MAVSEGSLIRGIQMDMERTVVGTVSRLRAGVFLVLIDAFAQVTGLDVWLVANGKLLGENQFRRAFAFCAHLSLSYRTNKQTE